MKLVVFNRWRVSGPVVMSCIPLGRVAGWVSASVTGCGSASPGATTSPIVVSSIGVAFVVMGGFQVKANNSRAHLQGKPRLSQPIPLAFPRH
jgi:hypothetical protein